MKLKIFAKAEIPAMSEPNKRFVNHFRKLPDYFRMFPDARFKKAKKGLCVLIFTDLKEYSQEKDISGYFRKG